MKILPKEIMFAVAVLWLAVLSGSAQVLTPIYNFDNNTDDQLHNGGLLLSSNTLYAATAGSGGYLGSGRDFNRSGAVFKLYTDGTGFTNLYIFSPVAQLDRNSAWTNTDGANSEAQLVLSGNRMYGTTAYGGFYGSGTVFAINTDGTGFTNLHDLSATVFTGLAFTNSDGAKPSAGLAISGDTLYGTTSVGGSLGGGTVFAIQSDGTGFTNLYNFTSDYAVARTLTKSSLIVSNNTLYGTTTAGGSSGNGTVFALNTDGTGFTNVYSFTALVSGTNSDGIGPSAGLVLSGNTLYGTTGGDSSRNGTVFAVNTDGTGFTNLHNFDAASGGVRGTVDPDSRLALSGRTLYGTTRLGGFRNMGSVFAINTDGTGFATLHSFTLRKANSSGTYTNADGALPVGNLVLSGSLLYGTTAGGGANGYGTVFALDLAVAPPAIHIQFTASPTNGAPPLPVQFNSPAVDADGNTVLSWNWDFGDGSSSAAQNPSHTYTNAGTFFPILTCINNNGSTVTGSGPAIAAAYPSSILNGGFETRSFTNWTLSGQSQSVLTGSKFAHTGAYGAGLFSGLGGSLSQTLSTTPGSPYLVSFWLDYTLALQLPNDFQVLWNKNVLLDKTNLTATAGWTNIQLTVTATTNISTLQFEYLNEFAYFGLDDVSVLPVAQLSIAGIGLSGADLVLNATGALSGRTYHVLMATNLTEPLNQWTSVATNVADADGNLSITATNAVNPNIPQRFYILQLE